MFYISEDRLHETHETALNLFAYLASVATEDDGRNFCKVKIAAAYCDHAYNITFIRGVSDVYGIDIDLTGRLKSGLSEGEIVMNEAFYMKIREAYDPIANKEQFCEVEHIVGPIMQHFKGIPDPVNTYKLPRG